MTGERLVKQPIERVLSPEGLVIVRGSGELAVREFACSQEDIDRAGEGGFDLASMQSFVDVIDKDDPVAASWLRGAVNHLLEEVEMAQAVAEELQPADPKAAELSDPDDDLL